MRDVGQSRDEARHRTEMEPIAKIYSRDVTSTVCLSGMVITHEDLSSLNS